MKKVRDALKFSMFTYTQLPSCKPFNNEPFKIKREAILNRFRKCIIKSDLLMCCIDIEVLPNSYDNEPFGFGRFATDTLLQASGLFCGRHHAPCYPQFTTHYE